MAISNSFSSVFSNGSVNNQENSSRQFPIQLTVISARLNGGGLFNKAPDVYLEIITDSNTELSKRTSIKKRTYSPHWDEPFTLAVCEHSIIEFKIFSKTKFFDDNLIAMKTVKVMHWIRKESDNGKFENVKITIPLISKDGRERESKTGELKVFVNGTIERTRRGGTRATSATPSAIDHDNSVVVSNEPSTSSGTTAGIMFN